MRVDSNGSNNADHLNSILRASVKRGGFNGEAEGEGEWVGEEGRRAEFVLTVLVRIPIEVGSSVALYKFRDGQGNDFAWFARQDMELTIGSKYRIRATVKKHEHYKGRRQTMIIRLKKMGQEYEDYHPSEETGNAWDAI